LAQSGFVMNEAGPETTSGPPLLGEHSEEILRSIGYDDDKIVSLREAGTI
ncbi:MAG: CoA transferase, partial [Gammaproteobacteria bacterium]|nr:CoA transferase [Gammaproteobacteria bacterium]